MLAYFNILKDEPYMANLMKQASVLKGREVSSRGSNG
mgnify:CR=1 FL=1|jgi:hypothetical protein